MKKALLLFSIILCVSASLTVACSSDLFNGGNGAEGPDGLIYTLNDSGDGYFVSKTGSATDKDIVIPSEFKKLPVTAIGDSAFKNCSSLESITLPDTVTAISSSAFYNCVGLKSITLSGSLTTIGAISFYNCGSLESVTVPDSVKTIGNSAFEGCISLKSITVPFAGGESDGTANTNFGYIFGASSYFDNSSRVPKSLKTVVVTGGSTIGDYAFGGCASLESISLPDGVTSIGKGAFGGCASLESMSLPDGVTSIGEYAFNSCESLKSVSVPGSVTSIGNSAFGHCTSLADTYYEGGVGEWCNIDFGDEWSSPLRKNFFVNGERITELIIPDSVTSVKAFAFANFDTLKAVTVGSGVTSIMDSAFLGCASLEKITAGDCNGITFIARTAFEKTAYFDNDSNWSENVLYIGKYLLRAKRGISASYHIKEGTISIAEAAFQWCRSLESITLPNSVVTICDYAFLGCDSLESITFSNGLTAIGDYAFGSCGRLASITLPSSLISIGEYAFSACTSLESITIPDGVTTLCEYAFDNCRKLASITLPDSITSIYVSAFYETAYYINESNWENNALYIGKYLMAASKEISGSYQIKEGTAFIAGYAFYNCVGITSIILPDSVTALGDSAFYGCESLESITVSDSLTSIGAAAFHSCVSLKSITVSEGLTSIVNAAFYNCTSLESINYEGTVESWKAIKKGSNWDTGTPQNCTVFCTDGKI